MSEILDKLKEPFDPKHVEWRAGPTNEDDTKAKALAYAPARVYMQRLDEVMGTGWSDVYDTGPDGGVVCGITLHLPEGDRTRWDGAENTNFEEVKGGLSDAFKRACVKWGVGRYLYYIPGTWVQCEKRGKYVKLLETPSLPSWAKPKAKQSGPEDKPEPEQEKKKMSKRVSEPKEQRPYEPQRVREGIKNSVQYYMDNPKDVSEGLRGLIVGTMNNMFPGDSDTERHVITHWLFGVESSKKLAPPHVLALKRWLDPIEDGMPSQLAIAEARKILRHIEAEQGQKELM